MKIKLNIIAILMLFTAFALTGCGGSSNSSSETAPSAPGAPTVAADNGSLSLTWTAVTGATAYEVWYNTADTTTGATQQGGNISGTSYTITGLTNGQLYYVWLTASNSAGISGISPIITGTPKLEAGDNQSFTCGTLVFNMKYVPGGTFPTGINDSDGNQTISTPYWMSETQVTYELWEAVYTWAIGNGYTFGDYGVEGGAGSDGYGGNSAGGNQQPVTCISWRDAMVWCNALTEYYNANKGSNTALDCVYYVDSAYTVPIRAVNRSVTLTYPAAGSEDDPYIKASASGNTDMASCTAKGFRLPLSMEWELAARWRGTDSTNTVAGFTNPYFTKGNSASGATTDTKDVTAVGLDFAGELADNAVAVYSTYWEGSSWGSTGVTSTAAVKSKTANTLGLYDMCGNVWMWCFDWPAGYPGSSRVVRGGNWDSCALTLRVGSLFEFNPYDELNVIGFRFARTQ